MNISPLVEQTKILKTSNDQDILVVDLPKNIRYEVETLDRLNQHKMDSICQVEIYDLAIRAQKIKLSELLKELAASKVVETPPEGESA